MYAWPWSLAYAGALLAPALLLVLRAFDTQRPLALPSAGWRIMALTTALVVLASALASPHRGPSLQWSAPLLAGLAGFFVAYDALHATGTRAALLGRFIGYFFSAVTLTSLILWAADLPGRSLVAIADARNPYPLGHSNYTAGLALLALPWLATLAGRTHGPARAAWMTGAGLALATLFTSGSRGGLLGLGALALATLLLAPVAPRKKLILAVGFGIAGLGLALAHPRTRAMFARPDPAAAPNLSNVERTAWLAAGWRMGLDRPMLGWGPGTTPLAFPRYRAALDGGTENVLQLHSAPAQLWAELGLAGLVCALAFVALAVRAVCQLLIDKSSGRPEETDPAMLQPIDHPFVRAAAVALAGYAVFSFTDWQLDVPVFAFAVAAFGAFIAPASARPVRSLTRRAIGGTAVIALAVVALLGRPDPTPELNIRALAVARDPAQADRAIALLRESVALNPDQEIAHFNLGWLLLTRDPVDAEKHFLAAAHLVPDKGGVYFGLGLARLNQNHRDAAARAFAIECLNDPAFLTSPWWREPAIAALRDAASAQFEYVGMLIRTQSPPAFVGSRTFRDFERIDALVVRLGRPPAGSERTYRRERTGYPVLMRNLDLPPPTDLYDVREPIDSESANAALPAKGWLPARLLLALLDAPNSGTLPYPKSELGKRN
jgi:O-antigen ligase